MFYLLNRIICAGLERVHGFSFGDSLDENKRSKWQDFQVRLKKVMEHGFGSKFHLWNNILGRGF